MSSSSPILPDTKENARFSDLDNELAKQFPQKNTEKGQDSVNFTPGKTCP
jgi:hypothetical protein